MTERATTGVIHYLPPDGRPDMSGEIARLAAASAVEPILKKYRHHCPAGLIDERGKIRHVFTRRQGQDSVAQVIEALCDNPEAGAEFEAALAAQERLNALSRHRVEMTIKNARLLEDASLDGCGFQLEHHQSAVTDWHDSGATSGLPYLVRKTS